MSSTSPRMAPTKLGRTGLTVSPLALAGSFGIGADDAERAFYELGVNTFFVTSRMKGAVEAIRRLVRAGHRDEIVLISCVNVPTGGGVRRAFDKTAGLLGVEHVDVLLLGWVQSRWDVTGKTWPAMRALKESGRVRALGISCHDRPLARALVDELGLDVLMIRYNAAHRGAEREIFASLGDDRPGIIAYTATRWGRLLKPAGDLGPMAAAECYRFSLAHAAVDVVLAGAQSFDELADDVRGVLTGPLAADRLAEVLAFGDAVRASATGRIGFLRS
jgi:aryl-alcohol dehydrogenase-like predicted oxidoreductase